MGCSSSLFNWNLELFCLHHEQHVALKCVYIIEEQNQADELYVCVLIFNLYYFSNYVG